MSKDQYEFLGGGVLRDRHGRRELAVNPKHAPISPGDIATAGDLSDADGREQVVLVNPDGSEFIGGSSGGIDGGSAGSTFTDIVDGGSA